MLGGLAGKSPQDAANIFPNLYSGTFKRFVTQFPSISQTSHQLTSYVPHKLYNKSAIVKGWKHTHLPFQYNVKVNFHIFVGTPKSEETLR